MTRDDRRAECIYAMARAIWFTAHGYDGGQAQAIAAFDALHGIAIVAAIETMSIDDFRLNDLTNPPETETKP